MLTDVLVVSHTHWDREWYHSADEFRARLVRLIDELIDQPPPPGTSFLLDGQAVLLDDYLAVRPERAAELGALLRDGRQEAGPWYVLADELIPGGEALVRNLLTGRETVRRLRGTTPDVLYCPDSFGHPAMLPAIAQGFGCDVILLWRGLGGARAPSVDCMRWRAADGSVALVYHLPPDGYEYGSSLPADPEGARDRWDRIGATLRPRAASSTAILLNGADHHARQRDLAPAVAMLAKAAEPVRVASASLAAGAAALRAACGNAELSQLRGELRDSYGYTWTLGGTLGTRAHQKRANAGAERLLVRDVEPWIALQQDAGDAGARALLGAAWRTLLLAHPHDTLCGTSIDRVATEMDARLQSATEQGRSLQREALHALVGHDADAARANVGAWNPAVVIRNAAARARSGVVELTLRTKVADVAVGPGSATRQGERGRPGAMRVDGVRLQVLERREMVELTESPRAYPDADAVVEVRAVGWMESAMGGYTVASHAQRGRHVPAVPSPVVAAPRSLDNGVLRVEVSDEGNVTLHDLAVGRVVHDLLRFERATDAGDLYTPAIREPLPPPRFVRARVVHRGPIRGAIALEFRHCTVTLQLDANARTLGVSIDGQNQDADQRLRLVMGDLLPGATTVADAAFTQVVREVAGISARDAEMEHVVPTAPLHRWVARFASDRGTALVSDGLAEYEAMADGRVAVTLVRSVGQLSKHDLAERPGHAGWPAPTPGAQSLGPYAARFAVALLGSDSPSVRDEIVRIAEDALLPLRGETLRSNMNDARGAGGIELHGAGLEFSAAMPSRESGWFTLRCVNHRADPVSGEWHVDGPIAEAWRARLDETRTDGLRIEGSVIPFTAHPFEIVTIIARR